MTTTETKHPRHTEYASLMRLLLDCEGDAMNAAENATRRVAEGYESFRAELGYDADSVLWDEFMQEACEGPLWRERIAASEAHLEALYGPFEES